MVLIILTFLLLSYIQFGLFVSFQLLCWIIVLFLSNLLIGINPNSRELHVIRIISILVIMFILYYNTKQIWYLAASVLPLSIDRITYFDDLKYPVIVDTNIRTNKIYLIKPFSRDLHIIRIIAIFVIIFILYYNLKQTSVLSKFLKSSKVNSFACFNPFTL